MGRRDPAPCSHMKAAASPKLGSSCPEEDSWMRALPSQGCFHQEGHSSLPFTFPFNHFFFLQVTSARLHRCFCGQGLLGSPWGAHRLSPLFLKTCFLFTAVFLTGSQPEVEAGEGRADKFCRLASGLQAPTPPLPQSCPQLGAVMVSCIFPSKGVPWW